MISYSHYAIGYLPVYVNCKTGSGSRYVSALQDNVVLNFNQVLSINEKTYWEDQVHNGFQFFRKPEDLLRFCYEKIEKPVNVLRVLVDTGLDYRCPNGATATNWLCVTDDPMIGDKSLYSNLFDAMLAETAYVWTDKD